MLAVNIRVAWSLSAWELCLDRRGKLGTPDRHFLSREIKNVESRVAQDDIKILTSFHLFMAKSILDLGIESYRNSPYGLGSIYAPILSKALNNYLAEQNLATEISEFRSVRTLG